MLANIFEHLYVINLVYRKDRLKEIWEQLSRLNINEDDANVTVFPASRPSDAGAFPSIGARGCFQSHLGILRDAQEKGYKSILILEDDCNFIPGTLDFIRDAAKDFDGGKWALFYGGALNRSELKTDSFSGNIDCILPEYGVMGSHCVGIAGSEIAPLAEYFTAMLGRPEGDPNGGPMHVDGAYSWYRRGHPHAATFLAKPEIAYQRSSATDVGSEKWIETIFIFKPFVTMLRKIKNSMRAKS